MPAPERVRRHRVRRADPVGRGRQYICLYIYYRERYISAVTPESLFQALSDATRLRLLALLAAREEVCVCELTEALKFSQPMISRHLAQLRAAGMVSDRRAGVWIYYRLHPDLPTWARKVLREALAGVARGAPYRSDHKALREASRQRRARCV